MRSIFVSVKDTLKQLFLLLAFAYKVDGWLVFHYYFTAAIGALTPIGAAYALKMLIDALTRDLSAGVTQVTTSLVMILIFYYAMQFLEDVVYWGLNGNYYDYLLRNKLQNALSLHYSRKLSNLDVAHLENPEIQNLITKVEHSYAWQLPDALRQLNYLFRHIVGGIGATLVLLPFGWWIPGLIFLLAIPRVYVKAKHGNFVWSMYGGSAPQVKRLWYMGALLSERNSIIESRIFRSTNALIKKYKEIQDELFILNRKPLDRYRIAILTFPIVEIGITVFILSTLLPDVFGGVISVGSLTLIISGVEQLKGHISWGASNIGETYEKSLYIRPYFELLELPQLIADKKKAHVFKHVKPPKIEFRHVSFAYPNGRLVLKDVSFVVHPGENVALVGINGAGKSTIIKLLCRFYDVTDGQILINDVDLRDIKLENWYAHIGTLFQDFVKYNFTIRENIMLGLPGIKNTQRMERAAQDSGSSEFISRFEKGFDQMLGKSFEEGEDLSGGQWQKLAIARAFYQDAPVLILDEPTSAIDAESEFEIFSSLEKRYRDKSLILVSHRFSTVRNAQKIIVLDGGEIIEQGSHTELLAKRGKYAAMFTAQAQGYV